MELLQSIFLADIDITQLLSVKDLGVTGILGGIIIYFYRKVTALETKIEEDRERSEEQFKEFNKEKDEQAKKYYDFSLEMSKILIENTRVINENNRIIQRLEPLLSK